MSRPPSARIASLGGGQSLAGGEAEAPTVAPEPDEPPPPEQLPATGADPPAPVPEQVTVLRTEQQELVADLPPEEGEDADVVAAPDADDEELQPMAALSGSAPNATETPAVPSAGPAALPDEAVAGLAHSWKAKGTSAMQVDKVAFTPEFLTHMEKFPANKSIPWVKKDDDFVNTNFCGADEDAEDPPPEASGPEPGLNKAFWHNLKQHGHVDQDRPTRAQIFDPLFLFFCNITWTIWRSICVFTDLYAQQVYAKADQADIVANNRQKVRRKWGGVTTTPWKVVRYFGILIFLGATRNGDHDHTSCWDTSGYEGNYGFHEPVVEACMPITEFQQLRRFLHFCDNTDATQVAARTHGAGYMPTLRLDLVRNELNSRAKLLMNVAPQFAIDEITGSSWVYGPAGFFKRTPGKKTPQGFQGLALCSKLKPTFKSLGGASSTVGVVMCHAFVWDLTKGALPKLDPAMSDTANSVLRLTYMALPDNAKNYDLYMDNRFATPRLMVMLLAAFGVFSSCTFRSNYFPLGAVLKAVIIPPAWEKPTEKNKPTYRDLPANICSWSCLTIAVCFDQGLCRMVTTKQRFKFQERITWEVQRRKFLALITKFKLALCWVYTQFMDPVDIEDHCRVLNSESLTMICY